MTSFYLGLGVYFSPEATASRQGGFWRPDQQQEVFEEMRRARRGNVTVDGGDSI